MTPADGSRVLAQVNRTLRLAVERFRPEKHSCLSVQAEDLSSLLAEVVRAGECLRELSANAPDIAADVLLNQERSAYRNNLEELERRLPDFHRRLLAERSRLLEAHHHLQSAQAWAGGNRNTF